MNKIIINGKTIMVDDCTSVSINGNNLVIGGDSINTGNALNIDIKIEGDVRIENLDCRQSVTIHGDVNGNIDAGGSIRCGDVKGYADAGGSITCGNVGGNIDAGGSVSMSR